MTKTIVRAAGGGFIKDIDLDKKNGTYYYEVELVKDGIEYDYIVDAKTGKVTLENEHDAYLNYDDKDDWSDDTNNGSTNNGNGGNNNQNSSNGNSQGSSTSGGNESGKIYFVKAKDIVLEKIQCANITEL